MILVVDDSPGVLFAFGKVLQAAAVPYRTAQTLADAVRAVNSRDWTAFVIDIFLPDGLGTDLLDQVRRDRRFPNTPVAVITADLFLAADVELLRRISDAGASLYSGALSRAQIEDICLSLLLARR